MDLQKIETAAVLLEFAFGEPKCQLKPFVPMNRKAEQKDSNKPLDQLSKLTKLSKFIQTAHDVFKIRETFTSYSYASISERETSISCVETFGSNTETFGSNTDTSNQSFDANKMNDFTNALFRSEISCINTMDAFFFYLKDLEKMTQEKVFLYFIEGASLELGIGERVQNFEEAFYYYKKAADMGFSPAQHQLGLLYLRGKGVEKNLAEALKLFHLAAKQGFRKSFSMLGVMYHYAIGTKRDIQKCIEFSSIAANMGSKKSSFVIATVYWEDKDLKKVAVNIFQELAQKGYAPAQYFIGNLYFSGSIGQRDIQRTLYYWDLAAKQNYKYALWELGKNYLHQGQCPDNLKRGLEYILAAAQQKHGEANYVLGLIYLTGSYHHFNTSHLITPDLSKAIQYFILAIKAGYDRANQELEKILSKNSTNYTFF